jgi:pyoverdine/dityrosine biosynthesis protein Dit1
MRRFVLEADVVEDVFLAADRQRGVEVVERPDGVLVQGEALESISLNRFGRNLRTKLVRCRLQGCKFSSFMAF